MKRNIISIDRDKCDGCGLCVSACHEGALVLVGGKAQLVSDSYCDGIGDCLPECPAGAIEMVQREADPFDAALVARRKKSPAAPQSTKLFAENGEDEEVPEDQMSALRTWPVQLALVSTGAEYLQGARLLIAADCTAFACGDFHSRYLTGRVPLIACPKLDEHDHAAKLAEILRGNEMRDITVLRMEVPCCGGIVRIVEKALRLSGKVIPWQVHTVSITGEALDQ